MKTAYTTLFSVKLRHSFYMGGRSTEDFVIRPTPWSRRKLRQYGLVFRPQEDGFTVYTEIEPDSEPPVVHKPIGQDTLRFAFLLDAVNPYVESISEVPRRRQGSLFYFNNLRNDKKDGRLHLSDSVAGARVGNAIRLASGASFTYSFAAPVNRATIEIKDLFGSHVHRTSFSFPNPGEATSEHRLDLGEVRNFVPGRYVLTDDHGGTQTIYYDPELSHSRPFGLVEIFSKTDTLTTDGSDQVPVDYRFLVGQEVKPVPPYHLQLEALRTTWRYQVMKTYQSNGIDLSKVTIFGIPFDEVRESEKATFTSRDPVPLAESPPTLELRHSDKKIRTLPGPGLSTPLQEGAAQGSYLSEMYVYV